MKLAKLGTIFGISGTSQIHAATRKCITTKSNDNLSVPVIYLSSHTCAIKKFEIVDGKVVGKLWIAVKKILNFFL